jgi:prepilin-type N-terminal cleavage/methylation domain-containing protein
MKTQRGFTLLEFVIVIMILGIISAIGSAILSQGFIGYIDNKNLLDADWQARTAMERIQRDIRSIRSGTDVVTASSTQLVLVNFAGNTIAYSLSGSSLMRQTNSNTSQILADGVQSITFSYFDANGAAVSSPASVRYISVSLNIVLNGTNYTVATSAYPRNSM